MHSINAQFYFILPILVKKNQIILKKEYNSCYWV